MKKILDCVAWSLVALFFAWFPFIVSIYDAIRGDRGTFKQCVDFNWKIWIDNLESLIIESFQK